MSAWVTCVTCGRQKLVELQSPEGDFVCGVACDLRRRGASDLGPRLGTGSSSTTARSRRDARALTGIVGGRVVPGSGSVPGLPGDRLTGRSMVEEKLEGGESHRLTQRTWRKLTSESAAAGLFAVLLLNLRGHRIAMLPLEQAADRGVITASVTCEITALTRQSFTLHVATWESVLAAAWRRSQPPRMIVRLRGGTEILMLPLDDLMQALEGRL